RGPANRCDVIVAAIGGAATIGGALISSNATSTAANDATSAASANNALQQQIYNSNVSLANPYIDRGNAAGNELNGFLGLGGDPAASQAALNTYLNSTGYQFDKNEGMSAITGDKAASGLLDSGSTLKALDSFGTGLAQQYGQQYAQNLAGVSGQGQAAVAGLTGAGENYANAVSSNNNNAATVSGNAAIAGANQINGLIGNAFGAFGALRGGSSFGGGGSGGGGGGGGGNAFSGSWIGG
ncbi:MAG: hypothetical protein ABI056_03045, partial [Caulobacteraceae bacterium]